MTQAEYWAGFCLEAVAAPSLVDNRWSRLILEEAAVTTDTIGFCGRRWVFGDGSALTCHPGVAVRITGALS